MNGIGYFNNLGRAAHETSVSKGWYEDCLIDGHFVSTREDAVRLKHQRDFIPRSLAATNPEHIDPRMRNDGEMLALMHSEVSEMWEAYVEGCGDLRAVTSEKIGGFSMVEEESADVLIRIGDYCHGRGIDLDGAIATLRMPEMYVEFPTADCDFQHHCNDLHYRITSVLEALRKDGDVDEAFAILTYALLQFCEHFDLDLDGATEAKMDFNKARPHKHGGKKF